MAGDMRRNIEVANSQVDHVGKAVQIAITGSPVFNDFDNTVKTFTDGIRQISIREGDDIIKVIFQRADKLAQ